MGALFRWIHLLRWNYQRIQLTESFVRRANCRQINESRVVQNNKALIFIIQSTSIRVAMDLVRIFNPKVNPLSPYKWENYTELNFKQKKEFFYVFFKKKFPNKFTNNLIIHIYSQLITIHTGVKPLYCLEFSGWFVKFMMLFTNYSHNIHNLLTFNILWKYLLTLSFY